MSKPVIILAAGGHAKVLIDALRAQPAVRQVALLGLVDADSSKIGQYVLGVPILGGDEEIVKYPATTIQLVNGLGAVKRSTARCRLFAHFKHNGYQFSNVIHPSAVVAADVVLLEGVQIMAGAVVQTGCCIGANAIINTRAAVDHDCDIGDHVHIAPGATLSGGVAVGKNTHIGAGATVIQGIRIGADCLVAAGAVVIRDVPDGATVVGVPAKEMRV